MAIRGHCSSLGCYRKKEVGQLGPHLYSAMSTSPYPTSRVVSYFMKTGFPQTLQSLFSMTFHDTLLI